MLSLVEIGSGNADFFFLFRQCVFDISKITPLEKRPGTSFEQMCIPLTQGCMVPILVEIGPVVQEMISKFHQCISIFRNALPLGKEEALYFNKVESPLPKHALV